VTARGWRRLLSAGAALSLLALTAQSPAPDDVLLRAMGDELARSMQQLRLDTLPRPYFIAYRVDEVHALRVAATRGSLVHSGERTYRRLIVELRVGDYAFDNTNFFGGPGGGMFAFGMRGFRGSDLPIDDNYREVRRQLWLATDAAYKQAVQQLTQKRAAVQGQAHADSLADFTRESVVTVTDTMAAHVWSRATAESLARDLSAVLRSAPDIYASGVECTAEVGVTRYVNSEGTTFTRSAPTVSVQVHAETQAGDGTPLADALVLYGGAPADLPAPPALADSVRELAARLERLRQASPGDTYSGPILFEGQAVAEVFNQVFAATLIGTRRLLSDNPMLDAMLARAEDPTRVQLGGRALPRFLSVTDNPTVTTFGNVFLGGYRVDDDGVAARENRVVDHGVLKTLLTTRVPVRGIPHSSGNRLGNAAVVTNLFVTADSGLSDQELRRRLLQLATGRGSAYGIVVRRVANPAIASFDNPLALMAAMRGSAGGSPTLAATAAWKVFPDGHEELIRNAEVSGINAAAFKDIVAVSKARAAYTIPFAGRRMSFGPGFGGGYAASYVVPSGVLFEDGSVSRAAGNAPRLPVVSPPWLGH